MEPQFTTPGSRIWPTDSPSRGVREPGRIFRLTAWWLILASLAGCSRTPVDRLARQLSDADHEVRYDAAKELEEFGAAAAPAAPALAAALSDPDPRVRYRSAKVLSKIGIGAAAAADRLAAALDDQSTDAKTRYYVVKSLANIEELAEVALPGLIATLDGPTEARTKYYAAKALGKIGRAAHSSIPSLERAAQDDDPKLRKAASEALAKVRPS